MSVFSGEVHADNTLYLVDQSRGRAVLTELLGTDFGGVLVSDCLAIYDDATPLQHKCYAHHRSQPSEGAVRNRLQKQRDHLFTFLDHDGVDATNNLAERQLRPAVIARKISCGNKTPKGARTWQILASLAATCAQRATSFIAELARAAPLQLR